jgi:tRNA pseudouridine38-40 synthase
VTRNEPAVPDSGDGGLVRLRLDLAYDGTDFAGWAMQPGQRTVEQTLSEALGLVLRLDPPPRLVVAGRTDAGVHAAAQVAHVDLPLASWQSFPGRSLRAIRGREQELVIRLAGVLPADLRVFRAAPAAPGFEARFSAIRRRYAYRICDDPAGAPPLRRHDVLWHRRPLDVSAMTEAATTLLGLNDFAAFCRRRDGATTIRTLLTYRWDRDDAGFAVATVVADAFCHSMVRALVGVVLPVGDGRRPPDWPAEVLLGAVRHPAVTVAPARGLVLEEVTYPPDAQLAERAAESRTVRTLPVDSADLGDS